MQRLKHCSCYEQSLMNVLLGSHWRLKPITPLTEVIKKMCSTLAILS